MDGDFGLETRVSRGSGLGACTVFDEVPNPDVCREVKKTHSQESPAARARPEISK